MNLWLSFVQEPEILVNHTILTALLLLLFAKRLPRGTDWAVRPALWLVWVLVTYNVATIVGDNIILLKKDPWVRQGCFN